MADLSDTYYAGDGIHGYGAQVKLGYGGSPLDYEAIPFVKNIAFGDMTSAVLDTTHLRSPAAHREKKVGLRDSGPMSLQILYRPKHESQTNAGGGTGAFQAGGLVKKWINRETLDVLITIPDGSPESEVPFRGAITKYQIGELGEDNIVMLSVDITPLADFSSNFA